MNVEEQFSYFLNLMRVIIISYIFIVLMTGSVTLYQITQDSKI